jgi:uncharacterized protein
MKAKEDKRVRGIVTLAAVTNWEERWPEPLLQAWQKQGVYTIQNSRTGQEMPLYYQIVEDYYQHKDRFDLPTIIQQLEVPILAFHGTEDPTVPVHMAHDLDIWNKQATVEIVEGANHVFGGKHPYDGVSLPEHTAWVVKKSTNFMKEMDS